MNAKTDVLIKDGCGAADYDAFSISEMMTMIMMIV